MINEKQRVLSILGSIWVKQNKKRIVHTEVIDYKERKKLEQKRESILEEDLFDIFGG